MTELPERIPIHLIALTNRFLEEHIDDIGDPVEPTEALENCDDMDVIEDNKETRIVLKTATFPPNNGITDYNLHGHLLHMKRRKREVGQDWEDVLHFKRSSMKAGEYVRIQLGPNNLRQLFLVLARRFNDLGGLKAMLAETGIEVVDRETSIIIEGDELNVLQQLIERDPNFWSNVAGFDTTNALQAQVLQQVHNERRVALNQFRDRMDDPAWLEKDWEHFFKANQWIFGLGLTYQFLGEIQNQAYLGGTGPDGRGGDNTDFLHRSMGDTRFTVIIDIKRPTTPLLGAKEYRSNVYNVEKQVVGGVAQLQSYCHSWSTEGATQIRNAPERLGAHTYEPKGILVIGNLSQLQGATAEESDARRKSFELFRRNLHNPQIIAFDELLARAEYVLKHPEIERQAVIPATIEVQNNDFP